MDPVAQLQADIYGRIAADPYFADIAVMHNEKGVDGDDIIAAMGAQQVTSGKSGACVIVDRPFRHVEAIDLPGPEWKVRVPIGILEQPAINRVFGGTGKTIEEIISRVGAILHTFYIADLGCSISLGKDAVTPLVNTETGDLLADVFVEGVLNQEPDQKASNCLILGDFDAVIIESTTQFGVSAGAQIIYTLDGSYPRPGNGTVYGYVLQDDAGYPITSQDSGDTIIAPAPIAVPAGSLLRVVAYADGMQASDVTAKRF